jgi:hypothetical protein
VIWNIFNGFNACQLDLTGASLGCG